MKTWFQKNKGTYWLPWRSHAKLVLHPYLMVQSHFGGERRRVCGGVRVCVKGRRVWRGEGAWRMRVCGGEEGRREGE